MYVPRLLYVYYTHHFIFIIVGLLVISYLDLENFQFFFWFKMFPGFVYMTQTAL